LPTFLKNEKNRWENKKVKNVENVDKIKNVKKRFTSMVWSTRSKRPKRRRSIAEFDLSMKTLIRRRRGSRSLQASYKKHRSWPKKLSGSITICSFFSVSINHGPPICFFSLKLVITVTPATPNDPRKCALDSSTVRPASDSLGVNS